MGFFDDLGDAVWNVVRAPDRIVHNVLTGDVQKAVSVAVSPFAGDQKTRDRNLRRITGAAAGALTGFVTGGPVGAVVGGGIGLARASKGHGRIKDVALTAVLGAGAGLVAGAVSGAAGAPQYGGAAGKFGNGLIGGMKVPTAATALDPVTGEFTAEYMAATGGGGPGWLTSAGSIAKGAAKVAGVGSQVKGIVAPPPPPTYGYMERQPDGGYIYQPGSGGPVAPDDKSIVTGRSQEPPGKPAVSWELPALLAGLILLTR